MSRPPPANLLERIDAAVLEQPKSARFETIRLGRGRRFHSQKDRPLGTLGNLSLDIHPGEEFCLGFFILSMLDAVLTLDTACRPGYSFEALDTDSGAAVYTIAVGTFLDALDRFSQVSQSVGVELELPYSQFPIRGVLNLVERIWRCLDGNFVAPSEGLLKNLLKRLDDTLEPLKVCLFHSW